MSFQNKKIVGVWMDYKHAFIISTENRTIGGDYLLKQKIDRSGHENDVYKNERFELAKEKAELKKFFKAISDEILLDDVLFIFGPGKSQEEFKNVLLDIHAFKTKEISIGSSAKITIKQMISMVEIFFEGEKKQPDSAVEP
jgi:hypothetical protein